MDFTSCVRVFLLLSLLIIQMLIKKVVLIIHLFTIIIEIVFSGCVHFRVWNNNFSNQNNNPKDPLLSCQLTMLGVKLVSTGSSGDIFIRKMLCSRYFHKVAYCYVLLLLLVGKKVI